MTRRLSGFFSAAALAAMMSLPAAAQEYSNGGNGASGRGPAILTPVEAYGVHRPGLDPADSQRWFSRWRQRYVPYYAPLSPVASTARFRPWGYHPLVPYYTPYYLGYSPHRLFNPPPRPYGSNGWGKGPKPELPLPEEQGTTPLNYAGYTSVVEDETTYWNMGGNGLVPYGAPQPVEAGPGDIVDAIRASRSLRRGRGHFHRAPGAPAVVSPAEAAGDQETGDERASHRRTKPSEPIPPGEVSD